MPFRRSHGMIYPTQEWNSTSGRLYKRLGTFFLVTDKLSGKRNNFEPLTFRFLRWITCIPICAVKIDITVKPSIWNYSGMSCKQPPLMLGLGGHLRKVSLIAI